MGEVYRAWDFRLGREVAVKVLPEAHSTDPDRLRRFEQEARAASVLSHPNILVIHDVGAHDGRAYLVTELLEGETLASMLVKGPLSLRRALDYATQAARGLASAHQKGILHRDLKPANLFVTTDGRLKVLDFGLARFEAGGAITPPFTGQPRDPQTTEPGVVLGTLGYTPPEQLRGLPTDARGDIFALGAILYEMIAGRPAFAGGSAPEVMSAILYRDPPDLAEATTGSVPPALERIARRCLAKEPDSRFHSALDLAFHLESISSEAGSAPPGAEADSTTGESLLGGGSRKPWHSRWQPLAGGATLLLVVALALVWVRRSGREPRVSGWKRQASIAVLPFRPRGEAEGISYLALALPDEIATLLSYAPNLAVRPFVGSSRVTKEPLDLNRIGRELSAEHLVLGDFGLEGTKLRVSVEAVHVADNRVLWRDSWVVEQQDLTTLRDTVRTRVSSGLLPTLSHEEGLLAGANRGPAGQESYGLFLRAAALSMDPRPNKEALSLLERATSLDPAFAPAWLELSRRSYSDSLFGGGESASFDLAIRAAARALALDPDLLPAAVNRITLDTNVGRLVEAFQAATELVRRRPASAQAHLARAYVLRYGGAAQESARECQVARSLDSDPILWSCYWTFLHVGDYERAEEFARLETPRRPQLVAAVIADIRVRQGDRPGARAAISGATDELTGASLQRSCLQEHKPADLASRVERSERESVGWRDSEALYWHGALLADCGFEDAAFRSLSRSLDGGYCSFPALDSDRSWDGMRERPTFRRLRDRARACRDRFLEATGLAH